MITKPWGAATSTFSSLITSGRRRKSPTFVATHAHEHIIPVSHDRESQEDPDKQHHWDGHINDHARPEASPG